MPRGRPPKDNVWDTVKGIPTPLHDKLEAVIKQLTKIQLRERGMLEFEAALRGKKVKPCETLEGQIGCLEVMTDELDDIVVRCASWMVKRRKARKG